MNKKYVFEKPIENNPYFERKCPMWFKDAKLGIFIHWGPYSVPAWAPKEGALPEFMEAFMSMGYDIDSVNSVSTLVPELLESFVAEGRQDELNRLLELFKENPYSEWYWNSLATGNSTAEHHKKVWGDKKYTEFSEDFAKESKDWNADSWTSLFRSAGAKYVITTAKHHDGYCLWPTKFPCPNVENWNSSRDLLGDLKASLESEGLIFSLYYSAGLDWALGGVPVDVANTAESIINTDEGVTHMDNQLKELIDRYQPSLIWQDIGYSKNGDFNAILDHYYTAVPNGVVNDRGQSDRSNHKGDRHFDYTTTEYFVPQTIRETPWEICRGISKSFGYNQNDDAASTLSGEELVSSLADVVSKNGNLLLGLGPRADGSIPQNQVKAVLELGAWMDINGEAIYGSRPFSCFKSVTSSGNDVRYTTKDGRLYIIVLGAIEGEVSIADLDFREGACLSMIGRDGDLALTENHINVGSKTNSLACVITCALEDLAE